MSGGNRYLLAYDIADDARLRRVAAIAERHGVRVQYSVFIVRLTPSEIGRMVEELTKAIHPKQDDIRLYPLPRRPMWELYGAGLWPEGVSVSGGWPGPGGSD